MKRPKFSDLHRYERPYRDSQNTDVTRTWQMARERMAKDAAERAEKVKELRVIGKKA